MQKVFTILQVIVPIFLTIVFGMLARKKKLLTPEENHGLQQFVMKIGLPCVLFNSCLTARIGMESLTSMVLVFPVVLFSSLWAFRNRKNYGHHNFPMLFSAQESGMLGIPLFMILFGADQAYRMGVLDLTQSLIAIPTIAVLTADAGENPSPVSVAKKVAASPFLLMSLLGLALNLTGIYAWLEEIGIGGVITECTSFLAQPVSAMMIFSVGYNFTIRGDNRKTVLRVSAIHFGYYLAACCVIQGILTLIPDVDPRTRWAILLYCALPASYLAPNLGKSEEDNTMASGVCSLMTVASLLVFCVIAVLCA